MISFELYLGFVLWLGVSEGDDNCEYLVLWARAMIRVQIKCMGRKWLK